MTGDSGDWGAIILSGIAGLIGYQLSSSRTAHWKDVIKQGDNNIRMLSAYKIVLPLKYLDVNGRGAKQLYREAVLSFIFGLNNSCVSTSMRCLEIGLKEKHNTITQTESSKKLLELINWGEEYLGSKKDLAHGFRILRNLTHTDITIKQQDALETLRHISEILNLIYPYTIVQQNVRCDRCQNTTCYEIPYEEYSLYNNIVYNCPDCGQEVRIPVILD